MTWILFILLSTGESGPVPVSRYVCERTATEVQAGSQVSIDRYDGSSARVTRAACLGPAVVGDCELGETS